MTNPTTHDNKPSTVETIKEKAANLVNKVTGKTTETEHHHDGTHHGKDHHASGILPSTHNKDHHTGGILPGTHNKNHHTGGILPGTHNKDHLDGGILPGTAHKDNHNGATLPGTTHHNNEIHGTNLAGNSTTMHQNHDHVDPKVDKVNPSAFLSSTCLGELENKNTPSNVGSATATNPVSLPMTSHVPAHAHNVAPGTGLAGAAVHHGEPHQHHVSAHEPKFNDSLPDATSRLAGASHNPNNLEAAHIKPVI
ncbi:hypothetical protein BGZ94_006107 [Podila epigama]|nr:hypothetical protein BGZ94_006107 [Podila epigama]